LFPCKKAYYVQRQDFTKIVNCVFSCLEIRRRNRNRSWNWKKSRNRNRNRSRIRNRNRNLSKVGTGTVKNNYGSATLVLCFVCSVSPALRSFPLSLQVSHTNENFKKQHIRATEKFILQSFETVMHEPTKYEISNK
jgi:hypothetical protein